ncbi:MULTISPECIES: 4'-phosphopantetheinyl transferase family protein [Streptomyces]|uniref:4'-phosphopantetheinyl transferase family protein n=1 Tax=Streptomyces nondiastaticus TaxID=3154512 RepID=A0ABW6TWA1_9ACTN|nr:4'-phosphopantetheinyl transferase superfamily protein [Streptomyces sp. VNUA116]WKU45820.1 4'-phosphopantetheinyl transferase superfamily protein [Streptomyces sp. VNUA116]
MQIPSAPGAGRPLLVHGTVEEWAARAAGRPAHPDDGERLAGLRDERLRRRFRASRLLLRTTLGALCGRDPDRVRLARTALGRPYAPDLPELDFSLSHTGSLLAVAVLRGGRVGIDAERPGRPMSVLEHRMCTPHERAALDARGLRGAARDAELLRLWTLKEAYTKALGTGLRHPPRTFGLDAADPAGRPAVRDAAGTPLTGRLSTATQLLGGVLVSVVAARPSREPVEFEPGSSR